MSRLQKVKEHNKNILMAISILGMDDKKESKKLEFGYIDNAVDFIMAKRAFITFFDKLLEEYNARIEVIGEYMDQLNAQKEEEAQIPIQIQKLKEDIKELTELTKTKDENYNRCASLYERRQQYLKDLEAMEKYTVTEYENKREPRSETYFQMTYDPSTKTSRMMPMTRIVYVTRRVEKVVTKYRPDEAKRAKARAELANIDQEIKTIPTYDHNIKVYKAYEQINVLNKKIKELEEYLATAKDRQDSLSTKIREQIDSANKLKDILTKEKELIESMLKDPSKWEHKEIEDSPEL